MLALMIAIGAVTFTAAMLIHEAHGADANYCTRVCGQDGEVLETPEQEACHARCIETPKPARFRPWQQAWQCNDLRVTVTAQNPDTINYDIGGSVWGGINFTVWRGQLYLRGAPCVPLR